MFSNATIEKIEISVDDRQLGIAQPVNTGPLYVIPWQPQLYMTGVHSLHILVHVSHHQLVLSEHNENNSCSIH